MAQRKSAGMGAIGQTHSAGPAASPTGHGSARQVVAVAFSGGRDSLALLHATCRAARGLGASAALEVLAIHVHHGLLPEADGWLRNAQRLVARWRHRGWPVRLASARLHGPPPRGASVEAWARAGRHAALTEAAREAGASLLLLAHHRRDQAETVLLQALRGAGPAGLSAMPVQQWRHGVCWARPWLDQPREAIDAYVRHHRLRPLEDPSNRDTRHARNRLRQEVWPAFAGAFAQAEVALAAVARRAQEAREAVDTLAAIDLAACMAVDGSIGLAHWHGLASPARQAAVLRLWWRRGTGRSPPETGVARLLAELHPAGPAGASAPLATTTTPQQARPSCAGAQTPSAGDKPARRLARCWPAVAGWQAVAVGERLALHAVAGDAAGPTREPLSPGLRHRGVPPPPVLRLDLSLPGRYPVPEWAGVWVVERCDAGGAPVECLRQVELRPRAGGERFQLGPGRPARPLKKQFQALGIAADCGARDGPLLWSAQRLLFVPGLGLDARAWAAPGAAQSCLRWLADPSPDGVQADAGVAACAGGESPRSGC